MESRVRIRALFVVALFGASLATAAPQPAAPASPEMAKAMAAAEKAAVHGPADLPLADQVILKLPANHIYLPSKEAGQLMRAMGNRPGENLQGLILPGEMHPSAGWLVVMRWEKAGYIKDDDARDWDAEAMLTSIKEGTEEVNRERAARGIPQMEIVGWVEQPTYVASEHQLVWSISSRDKGAADNGEQGINYNTFALGREGYFSMNLVTDLKEIGSKKAIAKELLLSLNYLDGKRYTDFNSSTDKVAAYGIAALVGVAAAKKLGLLAMAGVFFVKFWKLIAIGAVGVAAVLRKRLGRTRTADTPPAA
jgi:uncharacterized membrane-anchored protein